ncbi:phenylalanine--tRNA ligase subunit alpha [Candidatus Pacearchaeota archaeon CG10_big_fil_rev_8_21_14_0_10_35_219]|nr:phenylalanine--tRNA ligase subunit alpha [Candidatus Pacearchaeota archaeon]OIO43479.1 MAG: phenylalanine--tRNA ligase subunit alpha [Candidatus Pacearchaeota archaeon CG1_02_35_32]PIO07602.1 MAG: phenylalanine--tRNA ligase subunit alpha [Candidatus Pacearchaeota archaeon CG10_big_fil_rev_8_21_14_0_10_35_219]PIY81836.1 MAG: phenylalanine--tRNA ligase subunit alpha [Candidatus Pacearchaeota archaeon CG_4_10_14_0_8_um_filter_35_169]PIZ80702.1 MAG: phenylalanine--tRNA ligase subunit alpha [Cand
MGNIIDKLSPLELKIIPFLGEPIPKIIEKSNLDKVSVLRALKFLENKKLIKIEAKKEKIIDLDVNGIHYKKNHLPERNLLLLLSEKNIPSLEEAKSLSKLSDNEFKVSLGVLKKKALIEIKSGKIFLSASKQDLSKKTLEEKFLESLPLLLESLEPEQKFAYQELSKRKQIIEIEEKIQYSYQLTTEGKKIAGKKIKSNLLEEVTPSLIKNATKKQKFRHYDIQAGVPKIFAGKRHFVNQSIQQGKRIWLDLGFQEMTGNLVQTSFWNFDALFTAQDHPVRDLHDTFFIKKVQGKLPDKTLVEKVKKAHETGIQGSRGWRYSWLQDSAKKVVLRTHTTCLSAQTLASLKGNYPAKFFVIGKNFRNETVDWSHGFEFNQTEGIVIDPNANFRHLIGYLKEFAEKMGYKKFRIQPAYFPYTEPSLEGAVWNPEKKTWMEVLAAGIFRPEVTIPLLGTTIPVLAWGPGFDRLMMGAHKIKDLRELYRNDIKDLRNRKVLAK